MASALERRWEDRLQAWAEYMAFAEKGGKVKISGAYSLVGRGVPGEGDGVPIYVGEALDTDALFQRLSRDLQNAVREWYCETGLHAQKAQRLGISTNAFELRVKAAKHRLEDMHRARAHGKPKSNTRA